MNKRISSAQGQSVNIVFTTRQPHPFKEKMNPVSGLLQQRGGNNEN